MARPSLAWAAWSALRMAEIRSAGLPGCPSIEDCLAELLGAGTAEYRAATTYVVRARRDVMHADWPLPLAVDLAAQEAELAVI